MAIFPIKLQWITYLIIVVCLCIQCELSTILLLYSSNKKRKDKILPHVRGLTVYLKPSDADIKMLKKTIIKVRETASVKKNTFDSCHTSK